MAKFPKIKKEVYETILDSIADGVFTVNTEFIITSFNKAAERITGFTADEAIGRKCFHIFRTSVCQTGCYLRQTMGSGENFTGIEVPILARNDKEKLISISTAALHDNRAGVIGGVETFRDMSDVARLRKEVTKLYRLDDMVSKNHRMQEIFAFLPDIASSTATVIIYGETGTGKEVLAKAIHSHSDRKSAPLVTINCSALPDSLLESELFGYVAGAFTDAKKNRKGRFAQAEGGTIFLDEIGDITPAMQVKLLRVLQDKSYEPVGSDKTVHADVRVIAATHRDIEAMANEEKFRLDLFYRLNVVPITLPPLRERKEDIPLLVDHFLEKHRALIGKPITRVSEEVMSLLMAHDFPGNIRELEHAIEHAFVLCHSDVIHAGDLPPMFREPKAGPAKIMAPQSLAEQEMDLIWASLERNRYNKVSTATELGLSRTTLWRKMKQYNIPMKSTNSNYSTSTQRNSL